MAFQVKKHLIKVQGGREYLPVAYRLVWFREEHPDWGIETTMLSLDVDKGAAVWQAKVYNEEGRLLATGTKMETARGFADYIEKSETGAIGRALGVLGYGTQFAPELDEGDRLVDSPLPARPADAAHQGSGAPCYCAECGRPLTKGQCDFSTKKYGRALCPSHQVKDGAAAAMRDFSEAHK